MTLRLENVEEFRLGLKLVDERAKNAARAAVYLEMNNIMAIALPLTPKEGRPNHPSGALRSSAYVTIPEEDPMVEGGFGGPAKDYAVVQHEDLSLNHTTPGTCAKYFEIAIDQRRANMKNNLGVLYQAAFDQNAGPPPAMMNTNPDQGEGDTGGSIGGKSRGRGRSR